MKPTKKEMVQHLTPPPGVKMPPYPKTRDQWYRWSLVFYALGVSLHALGLLMSSQPLAVAGQGIAALAVVSASVTFLVWIARWHHIVRGLALIGLLLWIVWPVGAWDFTLASAAIMAAKEAHCFHFWPGRILPWWSLALALSLWIPGLRFIHAAFWVVLSLLAWWLAMDRRRLPLFELG